MKKLNNHNKPLLHHFQDLKTLITHITLCILLASIFGYFSLNKIISFINKNILNNQTLHFFNPLEPILFTFKFSVLTGIIFSIPFIAARLCLYCLPIFKNKKTVIGYSFASLLLFIIGIIIAFKFICPYILTLMQNSSLPKTDTILGISSTIGMIYTVCITLGIVMQFPVVLFILLQNNIITLERVKEFRKFYICGSFVLGGILTPPDVFSQIVVAILLILSFEITIFMFAKCKGLRQK